MTDHPEPSPVKLHHLKAAPFPEQGGDPKALKAAFAGTALAHWQAFHDGIDGYVESLDRGETAQAAAKKALIDRIYAHQGPWVAAWIGAALLDGWPVEDAVHASVDGQDYMVEHLWQWLGDVGIDPETIASAADVTETAHREDVAATASTETTTPPVFYRAPDPDVTVRLDPAAEARSHGMSVDEVGPAEDAVGLTEDALTGLRHDPPDPTPASVRIETEHQDPHFDRGRCVCARPCCVTRMDLPCEGDAPVCTCPGGCNCDDGVHPPRQAGWAAPADAAMDAAEQLRDLIETAQDPATTYRTPADLDATLAGLVDVAGMLAAAVEQARGALLDMLATGRVRATVVVHPDSGSAPTPVDAAMITGTVDTRLMVAVSRVAETGRRITEARERIAMLAPAACRFCGRPADGPVGSDGTRCCQHCADEGETA